MSSKSVVASSGEASGSMASSDATPRTANRASSSSASSFSSSSCSSFSEGPFSTRGGRGPPRGSSSRDDGGRLRSEPTPPSAVEPGPDPAPRRDGSSGRPPADGGSSPETERCCPSSSSSSRPKRPPPRSRRPNPPPVLAFDRSGRRLAASSRSSDPAASEMDDRRPLLAARADAAFAVPPRRYKTGGRDRRRTKVAIEGGDGGGGGEGGVGSHFLTGWGSRRKRRRDDGFGGAFLPPKVDRSRFVAAVLVLASCLLAGFLRGIGRRGLPAGTTDARMAAPPPAPPRDGESVDDRVTRLEAMYEEEERRRGGPAGGDRGEGTTVDASVDGAPDGRDDAETRDAATDDDDGGTTTGALRRKRANAKILERLRAELPAAPAQADATEDGGTLGYAAAVPSRAEEAAEAVPDDAGLGGFRHDAVADDASAVRDDEGIPTATYVLPVFDCYPPTDPADPADAASSIVPIDDATFHDAALLLKAGVHRSSALNPGSGSRYRYEMVALIHPDVVTCAGSKHRKGLDRKVLLEGIGYEVRIVSEPIREHEIRSEHLRRHARADPDGGLRELIRLEAFNMADKAVVVLVDLNAMVLRPPDDMLDLIVRDGDEDGSTRRRRSRERMTRDGIVVRDTLYGNGTIVSQGSIPDAVDVVYTRDYTTVDRGKFATGVNLGFLALRPSRETYERLLDLYRTSEYDTRRGWGSKGYVGYPGSMTTRGIVTYYYNEIDFGSKVELHQCAYGNAADAPRIWLDRTHLTCRDAKEQRTDEEFLLDPECTDCRAKPFEEVVVASLAVCRPAWTCHYHNAAPDQGLKGEMLRLCQRFHAEWFRLRRHIEDRVPPFVPGDRTGVFHPSHDLGYCRNWGLYVPMVRPSW